MLHLVLRLARAQGLLQVVPEAEQAIVEHLEGPAHVVLAGPDEEARRLGRVRVARPGTVALPSEHAERDQGVEEVGDGAGMELQALTNLVCR